jgi:toxin CcdB
MAQFDVYQNKNSKTSKLMPFLLDIQSDLLDGLASTVVIPMYQTNEHKPLEMARLTPRLTISGSPYLLLTPQLAGIARKELGSRVENIAHYRNDIIAALDFLISGI